jgi:cytochrome c oxidase subunit 2
MRGRQTLWIGVALVAVGIVGVALLGTVGPRLTVSSPVPATPPASQTDLGKRIFAYGVDERGKFIPRSGGTMMMGRSAGCAACHGADGRGRRIGMMMGDVTTPDIRWRTLTTPQTDTPSGTPTAFDRAGFARAVRTGVDDAGGRLNGVMPRWELTDQEIDALIAYLQQLP